MIEETKTPDFSLTEDQQKEINSIFLYSDQYEVTEKDFERLNEMFETPEDFLLLRKMLGIHTPNEAGITFKSPHKLIEAGIADREAYAIETAVSQMADERIRMALLNTYARLRNFKKENKAEALEAKNQAEFEEEKHTEEFEEAQEEQERTLAPNL